MALSQALKNSIATAEAGLTNDMKSERVLREAVAQLLMHAESTATQIQWVIAGTPHDSTAAALDLADNSKTSYSTLALTLADANNVLNRFKQAQTVVVTLTGTATGKKINGVAGPLTVALVDGTASITLSRTAGSADETIVATLTVPTTGSANGAFTLTF
jgi:hypothetical protein